MNIADLLERVQSVLDAELFTVGDTTVRLASFVWLIVTLVITLWLSRLAQRAVVRALDVARVRDVARHALAARVVHYAVVAIGLAVALETLGINLSALFAAGAVTAVAVGIAAQAIFENVTSGLLLLGERTIKPGDVLSVEGRVVKVVDIRYRATIVRTLDEEDIILPNSMLVRGSVTNYTMSDSTYRLRVRVGVVYRSDMKLVREVLTGAAEALDWRDASRDPRILMVEFADSAVVWEVSVWIDDPWTMQIRRSELHDAIWWALAGAGITIAFPQLDVHFDPDVTGRLGPRAAGNDGEAAD